MKNAVKNIKGFLESKGVEWSGETIFQAEGMKYRKATDEDFLEQQIQTIRLKNKKGEVLTKEILVTENLFLIIRVLGKKLEADLSQEWKNYLSKTPEAEQRRNEAFKRIARQDAHIAVIKGDADCMSTKIKKAIFNSDELDKKVKDAVKHTAEENENI